MSIVVSSATNTIAVEEAHHTLSLCRFREAPLFYEIRVREQFTMAHFEHPLMHYTRV